MIDPGFRCSRSFLLAAGALVVWFGGGCGSSTTVDVVGPTDSKCAITVKNNAAEIPAAGATATLTVTAERECAWSARADVPWVALSPINGQGAATVSYTVGANPVAAARRGIVALGGQSVEIRQSAAPCRYTVDPAAVTVDAAGGSVTVNLSATSGCRWRVQPDVGWVASDPIEGTGSAPLHFRVVANAGEPRVGTVSVGEAEVRVSQARAGAPVPPPPAPTPSPSPTPTPAPPTPPPPTPTPSPEPSPSPSPSPPPSPTPPPPAPDCHYAVDPSRIPVKSAGGDAVVAVSAEAGCTWVARTNDSWIGIAAGASGSGSGSVRLSMRPNPAASRAGTALVAGKAVTIEQEAAPAPCTYALSPDSGNVGADPQELTVAVSTQDACTWTAASDASWITIAGTRTGTGTGTFRAAVAANTGAPRTGVIHVGPETLTVRQAGATCSFRIKPTYYDAGRGPDDIRVNVTAPDGCSWTASSPVRWATMADGRSGSGAGTVRILVDPNSGPERTAELTIAGEPFHLKQFGGCAASIKPTWYNAGRGPDDIRIAVTAPSGCSWTASSGVSWVTVAEGKTGTGDGIVRLLVEPNGGDARAVTLTIASQPFELTQNGSK